MNSFLYPSIDTPAISTKAGATLGFIDEMSDAVSTIWREAEALVETSISANALALTSAAELIVRQVSLGGRLLVFGNGGSACDAERFVRLFSGIVPARTLLDSTVLTALANDLGAQHMFSRQVETYATSLDVVVAFTTSGTSANIVEGVVTASRIGASTIVFAGYSGAALASHPRVDVCLCVDSTSVHRIQEVQAALCDELQVRVGKDPSDEIC